MADFDFGEWDLSWLIPEIFFSLRVAWRLKFNLGALRKKLGVLTEKVVECKSTAVHKTGCLRGKTGFFYQCPL